MNSPGNTWSFIFLAWLVSLMATVGSLFFSEIMHFTPCVMCWYQRICMYPLVFILAAGLFPADRSVFKFAAPLALSGWLLAAYHNLLTMGLIPASAAPCQQGVSCATVYIQWGGFVTIPLLSLGAFSLLLILLCLARKRAPL